MGARRIEGGIARPAPVSIDVDGQSIQAFPGESVATALWAAGIRALRTSPVSASARGIFCAMGVCQECVADIDGRTTPTCLEPVREGMRISLRWNRP